MMKLKTILLAGFITCQIPGLYAQTPAYKNSKLQIKERVNDLLGKMTLAEKVGQLSKVLGWDMYEKNGHRISVSEKFKNEIKQHHTGLMWATLRADPWTQKTLLTGLSPMEAAEATNAIQRFLVDSTRLGIPMILSEEAPHGHMAIGATVFPTAIGQASTWNPALIKEMGKTIAKEVSAVGGHNGYGPVLDLAREPRWSRVEETYGEDPYLIGAMGEAMVSGFQGDNGYAENSVISTLKHFVAYASPEGGHNGGSVSIGERALQQHFLPPFEKAVKAGAQSVMTAYNSIDGIPCSSNHWLLTDLLRHNWGFSGFVVSDLLSISGLDGNHATAANPEEAAAQSINSGLDVDLSGSGYAQHLMKAVGNGLVSISTLDTAVSRVLYQKFALGLFENPYVDVKQVARKVGTSENKNIALEVARQSIVLLKNQDQLLPLSTSLKKIAVIGPNADNVYNQLGDYTAPQADKKVMTVLDGIKSVVSKNTHISYVKGCAIRDTTQSNIPAAVQAAKESDVVIVVIGGSSARDFKTSYQATGAANVDPEAKVVSDMESGEGFDRASIDLMGDQMKLLKALQKTGKPMVLVTIMGRPLNLTAAHELAPAILNAWYPGEQGGLAIAKTIFGEYNPAGRLPISFAKSVGQLPIYYNYDKPARHDYVEMSAKPLYAFGYGLSYTQFEYRDLRVESSGFGKSAVFNISFEIKNTGKYDGEEVPQLYVVDDVSSVVTPILQLKKFTREFFKKGETKRITFELHPDDLKLFGLDKKWKVEKGDFSILIGSSSDQIRLKSKITIHQTIEL